MDELTPGEARPLAVQLACPQCGTPLRAEVPICIDLARAPELRGPLLRNQVHELTCPRCEAVLKLDVPFLVWEPVGGRLLACPGRSGFEVLREHFEGLAAVLRAGQPAAAHAVLEHCGSRGALVDALLAGHWDHAAALGIQLSPNWARVLSALPPGPRVHAFDLIDAGGHPALMQAIDDDPEFGAAVRRAHDPSQLVFTPAIEAAIAVALRPGSLPPGERLAILLGALGDCARHAEAHRGTAGRMYAGIAAAACELPLEPTEVWLELAALLTGEVHGPMRAIALFNLAGGAYDRLGEPPWPEGLAEVLLTLFTQAQDNEPPADLAAMVDERIGELEIGSGALEHGIASLERAARAHRALQRPRDAVRLWCRLMRVHADVARRDEAGAQRHVDSALRAGWQALSLASALEPAEALVLGREVAHAAWHAPGAGRSERLATAAELSRAVIGLSDQVGSASDRVIDRIGFANLLLDNGSDDASLVEEAIALLEAVAALDPGTDTELLRLNTLATAWKRRTLGERAENLERSIACYREVLTRIEAEPGEGVEAQNRQFTADVARYNLGNALIRRLRGPRRANLDEALALHQRVMSERDLGGAHVQLRARSRIAMGNVHYEAALMGKPLHERGLQHAIEFYEDAVRLCRADDVPHDAATAWMMLGQAHAMRPFATHGELRRSAALAAFEKAGALALRAGDVALLEDIAARRGRLLYADMHFAAAAEAYAEALQHRRRLLADAVSGHTRTSRLAGLAPYAARLAYSLLYTGRVHEAVEAVHMARAVDLRDAQRGSSGDGDAAEAYRLAWAEVRRLETQERSVAEARGTNLHALQRRLAAARGALDAAGAALSGDAGTGGVTGYARLGLGVDGSVLVALAIVTSFGAVLLYARGGQQQPGADDVEFLDDTTDARLRSLLGAPPARTDGEALPPDEDRIAEPGGWSTLVEALAGGRVPQVEIAQAMERFFDTLGAEPLVRALQARAAALGVREVRLVAPGLLQALPLPMASTPSDGRPWAHEVALHFRIGIGAEAPRPAPERPRLLVLADTEGDLPFARWEADLLAELRGPALAVEVLVGEQATRAALLERITHVDWLHLAVHTRHDAVRPECSALRCADAELSVQDLALAARAAPLSLVVLSGCDSALSGTTELPEEFVGLPAAFFALGARSVVASMWSLPDEATALLMAAFYTHLQHAEAPLALAAAQRELAGASAAELQLGERLQALYEAGGRRDPRLARRALAHRRASDARPFAHPLFWGALACLSR